LRLAVSQTRPKTKSTFKILRNGKERTVEVQLAELPTERTLSGMMRRGGENERAQPETLEGVEIADINSALRRQFSIPSQVRGAVVVEVDPESPAAEKLRPGDVILEIERKPVADADEAIELSNEFKGGKMLLRVWSRGAARYVFIEIPESGREEEGEDNGGR
jgi:serine protease Do